MRQRRGLEFSKFLSAGTGGFLELGGSEGQDCESKWGEGSSKNPNIQRDSIVGRVLILNMADLSLNPSTYGPQSIARSNSSVQDSHAGH